MNRDELNSRDMEMIAYVGTARSCFVEAIDAAIAGEYAQAEELIKEGKENFHIGQQVHLKLLQAMASGEEMPLDLLTVHAECQLMSAEDLQLIAEKVLAGFKNRS